MVNRLLLLSFMGAVALGTACSKPPIPPVALYGPVIEAPYAQVLKRWTREAKIYKGLENKLFVHATFHTPDFRRSFASSFPDIYGRGSVVTRRELVDLTGDVERFHTFFVTVYTPLREWNELQNDNSIWRITLTSNEGVTVEPSEIIKVPMDANLHSVYTYATRFDEAYLVRFPMSDVLRNITIGPKTTSFSIRVASALGSAEMAWELIPLQLEGGRVDLQ